MSKKTLYVAVAAIGVAAVGGAFLANSYVASAATAAIEYEKQIGGGAPIQVLVDNDVLKATLISFPKGHTRQGGVKRRLDQILVYIDKANYKHLPTPGARDFPDENSIVEPGRVTFHRKDTVVGTIVVNEPYRVIYVEVKK